ncbi:protein of unknown function [Hyphomicrobium sp. 1Nfss2.1]
MFHTVSLSNTTHTVARSHDKVLKLPTCAPMNFIEQSALEASWLRSRAVAIPRGTSLTFVTSGGASSPLSPSPQLQQPKLDDSNQFSRSFSHAVLRSFAGPRSRPRIGRCLSGGSSLSV